jgi:hypothetical protein
MRIFVTGTGRCGTVTFSKAAGHATNYTASHESYAGYVADWDYPDNHIEVSSQLVIGIPLLLARYPDARWVHLVRGDRRACVESIISLRDGGVVDDFCRLFFQVEKPLYDRGGEAIYETLNGLCRALLPNAFTITLEYAKKHWAECWDFMGCEGDYEASRKEWDIRYNARTQP